MRIEVMLSILALVGASTVSAFAAETGEVGGQTKMSVEEANGAGNKTPGQDVDDLITNNKLRAETGSKSRWSVNSAFSYSGGSIEKPLAEDRPNIAAATGTVSKAWIDGSVATKYNINTTNSLSAGVGLRWITPLNGKPHDYQGDRFDVQNPYVTYQNLYKWSGIQSVFQATPTFYTNSNLVKEGYVSSLAVSQDNIYEVGHSGLSVGLYLWAQGAVYNKTGPLGQPGDADFLADVRADQSDYGGGADPYLEYQLNDKVNLRTVANLWNYEHIRSESRLTAFHWDKVYQSVGVGISVTRDIFVYPNLQFLPDNLRADQTNVGLNTNINIF